MSTAAKILELAQKGYSVHFSALRDGVSVEVRTEYRKEEYADAKFIYFGDQATARFASERNNNSQMVKMLDSMVETIDKAMPKKPELWE